MGWMVWRDLPAKNGMAFYHYCKRMGDIVRRKAGGGIVHVAVKRNDSGEDNGKQKSE